jgi:hypothetical protein
MTSEGELIQAPDANAGPVLEVDSALLNGSLRELQALGYFHHYERLQPMGMLDHYAEGEWVPVNAMRRHYGLCDALPLQPAQIERVGRRVASPTRRRLLAALEGTARVVGFNPWIAIGPMHRIAQRVFRGGSSRLLKLGPKDLQLTFYDNPLFESLYFRASCAGIVRQMLGVLGVRSVHLEVAPSALPARETSLFASWV